MEITVEGAERPRLWSIWMRMIECAEFSFARFPVVKIFTWSMYGTLRSTIKPAAISLLFLSLSLSLSHKHTHTNTHTHTHILSLSRSPIPDIFEPFLVQFRLNLGLNNLKFVHKSISAVYVSIRSNRRDRIDVNESNRLQKWICGQILSCLDLNWV